MYNYSSTRFPYLSVNCHCGIYNIFFGTDSQFQTMCIIISSVVATTSRNDTVVCLLQQSSYLAI